MTFHAGPVPAGTSLYIPFSTYAGSTGASATCSGLAVTDIEIYKNGSTTQRASDAGIALLDTDGIDFDGITGLHGFSIDLSDNTDSGFFAVGSWYWVVISAITVDSQTVTFLAATFRIAPAESITGYPVTDVGGISGDSAAADNLESACDNYSATRGLAGTALPNAAADAAGGLPISDAGGLDLDSKLANTNEVTAARMGALTDWINGGRLDLILDIIAADTTTDIPALIATLQAFVDTEVAAIKAKTDNLPTDPADQSAVEAAITAATSGLATAANLATVAGYLDTEIAAILADTNELQTNQGNWLTATGFSTHSAADVLTALGTGSWATSLATQASVDVIDGNVDLILADTGTDGVVVAAGSKSGYALSSAGVRAIWTDDWSSVAFAADSAGGYVQAMATEIDGVVTKVAAIQDRVSYCLTVLVGACADAGTSAETYVHAIGGETFTVDYTGLDATGNRTTTTLSKV